MSADHVASISTHYAPRSRRALALGVVALLALSGCGGGDSDADEERLVDERIARERADAARDARQEERIRDLERDARLRRSARQSPAPSTPPSTPTTDAPSTPPPSGGDWPGGSAYTAILVSATSESAARATQQQATSRGLDAGVLRSADFRSLRPGYWVVFSGSFPSQSDASRRAARAKELGYADAYPRLVSP